MLWLQTYDDTAGYFNLGGSLTRCCSKELQFIDGGVSVTTSHIINLGRMIEVSMVYADL